MKKLLSILFVVALAIAAKAQNHDGVYTVVIARNANGNILANTAINLRYSIHDSVANGVVVYQETFSTTTSAQGMFNVTIGKGTPVIGSFNNINWGTNEKFVQTEMATNGNNFIDMGTQQMMSVPYALHAKTAEKAKNGIPANPPYGEIKLYNCGGVMQYTPCLPLLNTISANNITGDSAILGGSIINDGGATITQKGVCWSTSPNPTLSNNYTNDGNGNISYNSQLSGLIGNTTYYVRAYATNSAGTGYGSQITFTTLITSIPTLITSPISAIIFNTASSGGSIISNGNCTITSKGICWSTSPNPTLANNFTSDGNGNGNFSSQLVGLTINTIYYVRSYATNIVGTSYGNEISFTSSSIPSIGQSYQGGILAYVLQPGDPGYNINIPHGIIAAINDLGFFEWGCYGSNISGADSNSLGTGNQNTTDILNGCSQVGIAAKVCSDLVLNGFSDWYLPSANEMSRLYDNRLLIGGFSSGASGSFSDFYWTSTENNSNFAYYFNFNASTLQYGSKSAQLHVRAIRSF